MLDDAHILSKDGLTLYGAGFADAVGAEFGNESIHSTTYNQAVPWQIKDYAVTKMW
jgi:hypothetical protein